jgi:transcriptional regulator with XRE-family HTH domain
MVIRMESGLPRFGAIVAARRASLGRTRDRIAELGGPSDTTLANLEAGTGRVPSPATLVKLDTALDWAPGSAARTLAGGEPTPLEEHEADSSTSLQVGSNEIAVPLPLLTELINQADAIAGLAQDADGDSVPLEALQSKLADLSTSVTRLARIPVIGMLERNGGPGREVPGILALALAHHLDMPADRADADPADFEERLYLRWLAHRPVDIDDATAARFLERWSQRAN